jgi:hypothetical protein
MMNVDVRKSHAPPKVITIDTVYSMYCSISAGSEECDNPTRLSGKPRRLGGQGPGSQGRREDILAISISQCDT